MHILHDASHCAITHSPQGIISSYSTTPLTLNINFHWTYFSLQCGGLLESHLILLLEDPFMRGSINTLLVTTCTPMFVVRIQILVRCTHIIKKRSEGEGGKDNKKKANG